MARIASVTPDSPRRWGRMSAHGMICHLTDAFAACMGDRPVTDRTNLVGRTFMRLVANTLPVPWPKGIPTMPECDQEADGTPPAEFKADLNELLGTTQAFVDRLDPAAMTHPVFGRMSAGERGRWGYRHLDHHARQFGL
ncbi:MAG: DinB family protein [Gemmatimonadota bacterium]|nr:DinB family protein [Gemmatimonadota bacterium]